MWLRVNIKKAKLMTTDKSKQHWTINEDIEVMGSFYLLPFNSTVTNKQDLYHRLAFGRIAMNELEKPRKEMNGL